MPETTTNTIPLRIRIYSIGVMIIMSLGLAVMLLVNPEALPPELTQNLVLGGPLGLFGLLVAHYFATAVVTIFALYRRSTSMLLLLFMLVLFTSIPDVILSLIYGGYSFKFVLFLAFVYWFPSAWAIHTLWSAKDSTASETTTDTIPRWIWIYSIGIMILVGLGFAGMLAVNPGEVFPELAGKNILMEPARVFVIMNLATAVATIIELYRGSASMLLLLFMLMLLGDLPDYAFSVFFSGDYLFPFVLFLIFANWLPSAWGIRTLWSAKN